MIIFSDNSFHFKVWAPLKSSMKLHIVHPYDRVYDMQRTRDGYFELSLPAEQEDFRYFYRPDDEEDYPDPASQFQPEGVHGPSEVVRHSFEWTDTTWQGVDVADYVLYELHVGTFTQEGTFDAVVPRLKELRDLGITAIEIMPVAQFPGNRNWGYDGVFPYAVQNSYGGPAGLKRLVNACHAEGIAVILDVVYNHLGPEGNYLSKFGPYFTHKYHVMWGDALNFDDEWSYGVRDYFVENALYWMKYFHIDALRCDAIHAVFDNSALPVWLYMRQRVDELSLQLNKRLYLIAESDYNDPKVIKSGQHGGFGFHVQWLDDFHHALYTIINPADRERYYDFGKMEQLAKAYKDGFVHSGEWVEFRKRKYGASSAGIPGKFFVVFSVNHDQAGNRAGGERLSMLVSKEKAKLAAAVVILSPYLPMFFMGEEYGDQSPFYFFVSHSEPALVDAVRKGRVEEFKSFGFDDSMVKDPAAEETFLASKIKWEQRNEGDGKEMVSWYKELLRLRREYAALRNSEKEGVETETLGEKVLIVKRTDHFKRERMICIFNFSDESITYQLDEDIENYSVLLDSNQAQPIESSSDKGAQNITRPKVITVAAAGVAVLACDPLCNTA